MIQRDLLNEMKPLPADAMNKQVKRLLQVGAEGGLLTIYGTSDPTERRRYRFGLVDHTLQMLGEDEGA